MEIAKKKIRMQTLLMDPIIDLERSLENILKKGKFIGIKCHNIPGDNNGESYDINLTYYKGRSPEEWLLWKDKLFKPLDGQSISTGLLRYTFTQRLLIEDTKATFNQAALDIGIRTVYNFNNVLAEMTKHANPAYASRKQKRYLHRHLIKPKNMKLSTFISRLQELNAYLEEFPPDAEGQVTTSLPVDEIMDIIYQSMPTTWKNKMIEQGFNYADSNVKEMADFF